MEKMYIILRDAVEYEFDPTVYTQEEAVEIALEWWDERKPEINVFIEKEECVL